MIKLRAPPQMRDPHKVLYHNNGGNYIWVIQIGKLTLYNLDKQTVKKQYPFPAYLRTYADPYGCLDPVKGNFLYIHFQ